MEIPDYIPKYCNADCKYHSGIFSGKCSFYNQAVIKGSDCIAVKYIQELAKEEPSYGENERLKPICPNCKTKQDIQDALFCFKCGSDIYPKETKEVKVCSKCNTQYDLSYEYCNKDGNKLVLKEVNVESNNIRVNTTLEPQLANKDVTMEKEQRGFGWGNFLIGMGFFQGTIAFIFGFLGGMETDILPNRGVALLVSVLALGSAFGLYQRRLYGLYLLYCNLIMIIIFGIISIYVGDEIFQILGILVIVISVLWGIYFNKREAMFT